MSRLIKIYTVCRFSIFRLWCLVLNNHVYLSFQRLQNVPTMSTNVIMVGSVFIQVSCVIRSLTVWMMGMVMMGMMRLMIFVH